MANLDTLRPEVQAAMRTMDGQAGGNRDDAYDVIEAELLRLTDDCARLVDCINAQPPTRRSLIDRAERAEAELAALKARIAEAPVFLVDADIISGQDKDYISAVLKHDDAAYQYPDLDGKRVRLVVEE